MRRLETSFAGLKLKNPFIVSSSGLTSTPEKNKKWEDAGASAVVLNSLFQQVIEEESLCMQHGMHSEEMDYLLQFNRGHRLNEYIRLITETKERCTIPVIASINCFQSTEWTNFARHICEAGADALELNIMGICGELEYRYGDYEYAHIEVLRQVRKVMNIPVVVKLGSRFTNVVPLVHQLVANGASGVVLFNRMVALDIDIDSKTYVPGYAWRKMDFSEVLRWTGLVSSSIPSAQIAASGGVEDGKTLIKALLAGASAVEVCSSLYRNGAGVISEMLHTLETWMRKNGYACIDDFKGVMNADNTTANEFERTQFYRLFSKK